MAVFFRKTFVPFWLVLLAIPQLAYSGDFSLVCASLDPVTQQPKTVFAPGSEMLLRMSYDIPQAAVGKQMNIKVAARLRVSGIALPYTLEDMKITLPDHAPDPDGSGEHLPYVGVDSEEATIRIPSRFPTGSFKLKVKASVEGSGKDSCKLELQIAQ